jgi:DNA polymerase-3 subunit alpha
MSYQDRHFTHLHLHTDYSLLDGAISIDTLITHGKERGRRALAISDHGNIFGAVKFFEQCKKHNIKAILAMEAYITDDITIKDIDNRYYHLLLIVMNKAGYKNICRLISHSYTKGFYFKPRLDYSLLQKYNEGIIATSTCLGGHIPQLILQEKDDAVRRQLDIMTGIFEDRYYLEVQPPILSEQAKVNDALFTLEKKYNLPLFVSGDCHYATKEDKEAHEVMLAVQTRTTMEDPNRMSFGKAQCHIQEIDEFKSFFPEREDIIWQSGNIADRCEFTFETNKLFFPEYKVPANQTSDEHFAALAWKGFDELVEEESIPTDLVESYRKRLTDEITMITKMGFSAYFLIVSDFIIWAKKQGIPVGPGRGSVAGSLVAWTLSITDVDPIKYKLFFERFLNPERVTLPDIDIDFCFNGREEVINYVKEKYGHDHVGQIITFGSMLSKGVVKDVARALGFSFEEANGITELIPDELKITLKEAFEKEPKLRELVESNPKIKKLFDIARRLEGLTRHASKHAAGVVISPEPIADVLPIYIPPKSNEIVTQYAMTELESLGFLKIDFLGLKNLTLIKNILTLIKKTHNIAINILKIPMDDEKTFALLQRGETTGVFQLESSGIKDVLRRLSPTHFEEVIAVNALYRPGPLGSGMVDDYIERKHGRQSVNYFFNELKAILKDTYGVIVYQEQVMQIANIIGGYSLGESDILRRAMGKKKADVMAEQKELFITKATEKEFEKSKVKEIFELMEYFAGYGFNKAHSAAYALIAYQTAYLKAHYPIEFMASLISLELGDQEKTLQYVKEAQAQKIIVLPPDILTSQDIFIREGEAIRWGLLGIKNVGAIAVENIIKQRKKEGAFKNFSDLCRRIDLRVCNKRVLESLVASGACDSLGHSREAMLLNLDYTMEFASYLKEKKDSRQLDLFSSYSENEGDEKLIKETEQCIANWKESSEKYSQKQVLEMEAEVLGTYLSEHPLERFSTMQKFFQIPFLREIKENKKGEHILIQITTLREITTKKGDKMAFGIGEDHEKKIELIFFPAPYKKHLSIIEKKGIVIARGEIEVTDKELKIKVNSIINIEEEAYIPKTLTLQSITKENYKEALSIIAKLEEGTTKILLQVEENNQKVLYEVSKKYTLNQPAFKHFLQNDIYSNLQ